MDVLLIYIFCRSPANRKASQILRTAAPRAFITGVIIQMTRSRRFSGICPFHREDPETFLRACTYLRNDYDRSSHDLHIVCTRILHKYVNRCIRTHRSPYTHASRDIERTNRFVDLDRTRKSVTCNTHCIIGRTWLYRNVKADCPIFVSGTRAQRTCSNRIRNDFRHFVSQRTPRDNHENTYCTDLRRCTIVRPYVQTCHIAARCTNRNQQSPSTCHRCVTRTTHKIIVLRSVVPLPAGHAKRWNPGVVGFGSRQTRMSFARRVDVP